MIDPGESSGTHAFTRLAAVLDWIARLPLWTTGILVFLGGMAAMLAITFLIRPWIGIDLKLGNSAYDGYLQLAQNLLKGYGYVFEPGGHKVFHRPPLYPILLMPGALLPEIWARIYVAVLNSTLLALAANILRVVTSSIFDQRTGAAAWAIFGFSPFIVWSVKNPMAPICQTLAYILILFCSLRIYRRIRAGEEISSKLILGTIAAFLFGVFSHGTMLADTSLLILLLGFAAIQKRSWHALRAVLCVTTGMVLCIAPWTWRNYKVTGLFIPVVGNTGLAYFAGNGHWGITAPAQQPGEDPETAALRHAGFHPEDYSEMLDFYGLRDPRWEKEINRRFKENLKNHPGAFTKKLFLNALDFYFPLVYYLFPPANSEADLIPLKVSIRKHKEVVGLTFYHLTLLTFASCGLVYLCNRRMRGVAIGLCFCWVIYAVPYFPFLAFVGHGLYTFGTIPILAVAAGVWLARPATSFNLR